MGITLYIRIVDKGILEAFATINKIFNYSLESNDRLTKIKMHYVRDYIIFEFDKVSYKTNKIIKNIGVCVDKKPLFLTSSTIHKNDNVKYKEESFCTYDLETSRIINRIRIKNTDIDGFQIKEIETLDKPSLIDFDYVKKDYTFYYDKDTLLTLKESDELYDKNNPRVDTALKQISKITDNIRHKVDSIVGIDNVKEYTVKRKEK